MTVRLARRLSIALLLAIPLIQACGDDANKPDEGEGIYSFSIRRVDTLPFEPVVVVAESLLLQATVVDSAGHEVPGAVVDWSVGDGLSSVNSSGVLVGVSPGITHLRLTYKGDRDSVGITVLPQADSMVLAPTTVGIVPGGQTSVIPYLYRGTDQLDSYGRLISWTRSNNAISVEGRFIGSVEGVSPGSTQLTATGSGVTRSITVDVDTLRYDRIDAGVRSSCGLTVGGRVYCWGVNIYHQLGHPFVDGSALPLRVEGIPTATQVVFGQVSACALATNGDAWCWGFDVGNLGRGSIPADGPDRLPGLVSGGLHFTSLAMGEVTTCGVVTGGAAYCWGYGGEGILGNGGIADVTVPTAVSGGHSFLRISMTASRPEIDQLHTCGVATDHKAWCWGNNSYGQLGIGGPLGGEHREPVAVGGGLDFADISVGASFTCGVTTAGAGYCWGNNSSGQLGSTGGSDSLPRAVLGGLTFASISAGAHHSCGVTTTGAAYCWGNGAHGELGSSIIQSSSAPVPVSDGHTFASITAGVNHTCGVTTDHVAYCWGGIEGETATGAVGSLVPMPVLGQP